MKFLLWEWFTVRDLYGSQLLSPKRTRNLIESSLDRASVHKGSLSMFYVSVGEYMAAFYSEPVATTGQHYPAVPAAHLCQNEGRISARPVKHATKGGSPAMSEPQQKGP